MNDMYKELYEKLSRLQWLLQRQHLRSHAEYGPMGDPTRGQGRVLAALKMKPEISMRDLSYLLAIRHQSLNELLNKLEKSGYITRTPSETDKRSVMIRLTEKGKNEQYMDMDVGIFNCLNEEERVAFGEYLDRVIAALEERVGDEPDAEDNVPEEDDRRGPRPRGPRFGPRDFPPPPPPPHGPHPHGPHTHEPRGPHPHEPREPYPHESREPHPNEPREPYLYEPRESYPHEPRGPFPYEPREPYPYAQPNDSFGWQENPPPPEIGQNEPDNE